MHIPSLLLLVSFLPSFVTSSLPSFSLLLLFFLMPFYSPFHLSFSHLLFLSFILPFPLPFFPFLSFPWVEVLVVSASASLHPSPLLRGWYLHWCTLSDVGEEPGLHSQPRTLSQEPAVSGEVLLRLQHQLEVQRICPKNPGHTHACTCMCTYIHILTPMNILTVTHLHTQTHAWSHAHIFIYTYMHALPHVHTRMLSLTYRYTQSQVQRHIPMHAFMSLRWINWEQNYPGGCSI